jgi:hypothetical protein
MCEFLVSESHEGRKRMRLEKRKLLIFGQREKPTKTNKRTSLIQKDSLRLHRI